MSENQIPAWLVEAALNRVHNFAEQLRHINDGSTPVPGLEWTVSDLAQHVACLPSYWENQHEAGGQFSRPENFAAYSDQARAHITATDPASLADQIEPDFEAYVAKLKHGEQKRWQYGLETTATNICGLMIYELVLHGRDLAAVTGAEPPTFDRRQANAAVNAILVTTPAFIDETRAAAQPNGVYHTRFKGGRSYTWTKQGSTLAITEGKPKRSDATLIADPAVFLLSASGRMSQVRAALSGGMISYGLKPWRFLGLGAMTVDGI